jgi:membrane associated rhomboid family serine protease
MDGSIVEDIKAQIRSKNPVIRLIVLNVAVFMLLTLLKVITLITSSFGLFDGVWAFFFTNLTLPLNGLALLYKPWTIITYMFTHTDVFHLLGNMLGLYWFGQLFVNYTSPSKLIPLYLMGGMAGALVALLFVHSGVPMLGASAGVTAIVVATAVLIPHFKMTLLFFGPVKIYYIAFFMVLLSVLNASSYSNVGGNLSHIGGALMGYLFIVQYKKGKDLSFVINNILDWFVRVFSFKPKATMKTVHKRPVSDTVYNANRQATQAEIDAILDKISKSGYDSLSKKEKELLFKASNNQ